MHAGSGLRWCCWLFQGQNRSLRLRISIDRDQVDAGSNKVNLYVVQGRYGLDLSDSGAVRHQFSSSKTTI